MSRTAFKPRKIWIATMLAFGLTLSASVQAQSLKEAVEQTLKTHPDIQMATNQRLAVNEEIGQAKGGWYPRVDLGLGIGHENSDNPSTRSVYGGDVDRTRREASLSLTQLLFDGGGVSSEIRRHESRFRSADHRLYGTAEEVAMRSIEAYLEVLRHRELLDLNQKNLKSHQRIAEQIQLRSDRGVGRKADVDQVMGRVSLARANVLASEANLREAEIIYRRVVGAAPATLNRPMVDDKALPSGEQEAIDNAIANNRTLKQAQSDIEAAQAQRDGAKSGYAPRIELQLAATRNRNLDGARGADDDQQAMLRMRWNLFRGGSDKARINETAYRINEAMELSNRTRRQVEEAASLAWNAYTKAKARLEPLKAHIDATQVTLDAYDKQFGIGQRTLLDLLDSENELFLASQAYTNAQFIELLGRYRVLAAQDKLLTNLNIPVSLEPALAANGK